jgi:L-gulonolactone oxidase
MAMLTADDKKQLITLVNAVKAKAHTGWINFSRSHHLPDTLVIDIPNRAALQAIVKKIYQLNQSHNQDNKLTYHASGGGKKEHVNLEYSESFSFSPCAGADVVFRLTGDEFQQITVDKKTKRAKAGAGLQIGYLDKALYDEHQLSLPTSSLFGYPTNVGLGAVAGHGTGNKETSFAGLITELTICCPDGKIVTLNSNHADFETIRAAHLGLFGIVLDQTIQCRTARKIHALREATHIPDLIQQLQAGLMVKERRVSIMYTPTYHDDERNQTGSKNVLIIKADAVSTKTPNKNDHAVVSYIDQELLITLQQAIDIPDILTKDPKLIPDTMRYLVSPVSIGNNTDGVGPWPDMMHYQTAFPWKIDDMDYLFQLSPDSHELVEAMEYVVKTLDQFAKKGQYPVTYAIYLRAFAGTNGGLSTSQHEEGKMVCAFDIVSNPETPGYAEFKRMMQDYFINVRQAKPHWGKTVPLDMDYEAMYGDNFRKYKGALEKWYKECGLTMAMSPLITPYFHKILKLPETAATAQLQPNSLSFFAPPSPATRLKRKDALYQAAEKIAEDGAEGAKLKQRIMSM